MARWEWKRMVRWERLLTMDNWITHSSQHAGGALLRPLAFLPRVRYALDRLCRSRPWATNRDKALEASCAHHTRKCFLSVWISGRSDTHTHTHTEKATANYMYKMDMLCNRPVWIYSFVMATAKNDKATRVKRQQHSKSEREDYARSRGQGWLQSAW